MINFIASKLEEPITEQSLQTCPKNATSTSYIIVQSLVDAINFHYESNFSKGSSDM